MRHGSLFSGIGGFDLAAEWMGWENVFHCEWNEFGRKILKYYWPDAMSYNDIKNADFTIWNGKIDILTGGFPCQPYSLAGKRLGKEDDRHLWPEMLRAIREAKPRYVVGENVYGLINWNGGMVFDEVQVDLENEGYKVQPVVLPACAVNAPHRRDRVWFVAYNNNRNREEIGLQTRRQKHLDRTKGIGAMAYANERAAGPSRKSGKAKSDRSKNNDEPCGGRKQAEQHIGCSNVLRVDTYTTGEGLEGRLRQGAQRRGEGFADDVQARHVAYTDRQRQQEQGQSERPLCSKENTEWKASWSYDDDRWPTQSPVCRRNDGISQRLDGITFSKWRQESIKAYGNAIVPQVAYQIFKAIEETEKQLQNV